MQSAVIEVQRPINRIYVIKDTYVTADWFSFQVSSEHLLF